MPRRMRFGRGTSQRALRSFVERKGRPDDALSYAELQGFLFAVACAPEMVPPSEWHPIIFGEEGPEFETVEQAQSVLGELTSLYNKINAAALDRSPALPVECAFRDPILSNFEDNAPLGQWARGFVQGHLWLEEMWDDLVPEELKDELASASLVLSFFSSRDLGEAYLQESMQPGVALEEMAQTMRDVFPDAMRGYANIGRSIHEALSREEGQGEDADRLPKTGRNAPCPCGSGKKYKRCHGGGAVPPQN